jgi:transposase-like protein
LAQRRVGRSGWPDELSSSSCCVGGPCSAFKGFRFPPEIIVLAVRWYLRYGLSYRDVEELLTERGIEVDHVSVFRWVQCFTPRSSTRLDRAAIRSGPVGSWTRPASKSRVAGATSTEPWTRNGQIIDVYVSPRRDTQAARRFFETALASHGEPIEVVTDRARRCAR